MTVSAVAQSLRQSKAVEGARKSYLENLESMQRVHLDPAMGALAVESITAARVEAMVGEMLRAGRAPKPRATS